MLLKSGHGGAMAERRGGFLKKCHRIAVAWRVSNGGVMAAAIVMVVIAAIMNECHELSNFYHF